MRRYGVKVVLEEKLLLKDDLMPRCGEITYLNNPVTVVSLRK